MYVGERLPRSDVEFDLVAVLVEETLREGRLPRASGQPNDLPHGRYAQAIALAPALRHSWRAVDLACILRRVGIRRTKLKS